MNRWGDPSGALGPLSQQRSRKPRGTHRPQLPSFEQQLRFGLAKQWPFVEYYESECIPREKAFHKD